MSDFVITTAVLTMGITAVAFVASLVLLAVKQSVVGGSRDIDAMCGTGCQAAQAMLAQHGSSVMVRLHGEADSYDAVRHEVLLGTSTHNGADAASVALACHEAGHALQHEVSKSMHRALAAVRTASFAFWVLWAVALVAGVVLASAGCAALACLLWCVAVLCGLAPCRLEADATQRALAFMRGAHVPATALAAGRKVLQISFCGHLAVAFVPVQKLH